jgi:hypothetical protein
VWEGSNGQNNAVSYVANSPITSWNNFNLLGFVDNTETIEPVSNSWYLTSIQAGFEPSTEECAAERWVAIAGRWLCGVGPIGPP